MESEKNVVSIVLYTFERSFFRFSIRYICGVNVLSCEHDISLLEIKQKRRISKIGFTIKIKPSYFRKSIIDLRDFVVNLSDN